MDRARGPRACTGERRAPTDGKNYYTEVCAGGHFIIYACAVHTYVYAARTQLMGRLIEEGGGGGVTMKNDTYVMNRTRRK